jgi:Spy/CpxP family protein refolding chaperone
MNLSKQPRLLILIIIVLLVSNVSTIVTINYLQKHSHVVVDDGKTGGSDQDNMPRGLFFKEKLQLSDEQHELFKGFHQNYNRTTRGITMELNEKRQQMVDELGEEMSDTLVLNELAVKIGELHQALKEYTIGYYLNMKEHCTAEQRVVLHKIFNDLLNKDGNVQLPAQGGQHRWGQKRREAKQLEKH